VKKTSLVIAVILVFVSSSICIHECAFGADYKIAPSDVLEISIYGEDALAKNQLVVRPDGRISFPLVGDLEVAGYSTAEVKEIVEKYTRPLVPEARAAVIVTQLGSLQYYVVGKVNKPGMYNVSKPLTVLQVLSLAGGPVTFAKESDISILRDYGQATTRLPFNYKEIKNGKHMEQNIFLERGDVVVVP
jgi:polysaccharide biosynthesis/export protein